MTVYVAVQVTDAPGARAPAGHATVVVVGDRDRPGSVTLPVFVTK